MSRPTKSGGEPLGHVRRVSNAQAPVRPDSREKEHAKPVLRPEIHFTALIKLPFARGDFVDPPQVDWDATKDRALWKVISRSSKTSDLDWDELAAKFEVTPAFMLQQAAWLYERHLSHVRAQMKKVSSSNAPTLASTSSSSQAAVGGYPMRRLGSGGPGASRAPSSLPIRPRDSPIPRAESGTPETPRSNAPVLSRTPSTTTITQSRINNPAPSTNTVARHPLQRSFRSNPAPSQFTKQAAQPPSNAAPLHDNSPNSPSSVASSSSSADDSSSSESDSNHPVRRSQIFKRPPRFSKASKPRGLTTLEDEDDEDGGEDDESPDSNTFLPFAQRDAAGIGEGTAGTRAQRRDLGATLRDRDVDGSPASTGDPSTPARDAKASQQNKNLLPGSAAELAKDKGKGKAKAQDPISEITSSATSSASEVSSAPPSAQRAAIPPGPLSPRHRAELARLGSPRGKGKSNASEGTPSMGSSFSDLDDASITQSALEEALLSNMQHGRMSTLSSLRSRYL